MRAAKLQIMYYMLKYKLVHNNGTLQSNGFCNMAGIARSWIAANWSVKTTTVSAVVITATGIALIYTCWWKSDFARRYYARNRSRWGSNTIA